MSLVQTPWYTVSAVEEIDSPALLLYISRIKHNLALAIELLGGDATRLRPHVKTHKSPQATALMLQAGITKFKCATVAEAEMLARCGAPDVLLAYQATGPKIERLLALMQAFPATVFSCLVDDSEAARALAAAAAKRNTTVNVFLDINVGMNRSGIVPEKAAALYTACRSLPELQVVGLHAYDGHITDKDVASREARTNEVYRQLSAVRQGLIQSGLSQPVMVVGGSPTFPMYAKKEEVECSPGTFFYWDGNYNDDFPDIHFLPAALVLSRVVSVINENRLSLDLGHKSIAAENPLLRRVKWLNAGELVPVGHSEEHLVMEGPTAHKYRVGDVLYGLPFHICPTCALYDTALVIENGCIKEEWQMTARARRLSV